MFDRIFTLVDLLLAFTTGSCMTALGVYFGLVARHRQRSLPPARPGRNYERVSGQDMLMTGFALGVGECCTAQLDGLQIISICDPETNESKVVLPMKSSLVLSRGMLRVAHDHLRHKSGEEFKQQLSLACQHIEAAAEVYQE